MAIEYFGQQTTTYDTYGPGNLEAFEYNNETVFTCPGTGQKQVKELSMYTYSDTGNVGIRLAIYDSSDNLVCEGSSEVTVSTSPGSWQGHMSESAITPNPTYLTGGENYKIAIARDDTTGALRFYSDVAIEEATYWLYENNDGNTYSDSGWPSTLPSAPHDDWGNWAVRCGVEGVAYVSEDIEISEYISIQTDDNLNIDIHETINLIESILPDLPLFGISVSEQMNLAESLSPDVPIDISEFEQLTINEAIALILNLAGIDVSETINITELIERVVELAGINISETINITEYINALTSGDVILSGIEENINVTEIISLLFDFIPISQTQTIDITESIQLLLSATGLNVIDTVNVAEFVGLILSLGIISTSETIEISEAVTALLETTGANVYDIININELVNAILAVTDISVSEQLNVTEYVNVSLVLVAGLMRIRFSTAKPKINFS